MAVIASIRAREILDSRGNPTLELDVLLADGAFDRAAVPAGASTGSREAAELRDRDPQRCAGEGVTKAVANVNDVLAPKLLGAGTSDLLSIDEQLGALEGTETTARLGSNAILDVSLAVAHATAVPALLPIYRTFRLEPTVRGSGPHRRNGRCGVTPEPTAESRARSERIPKCDRILRSDVLGGERLLSRHYLH